MGLGSGSGVWGSGAESIPNFLAVDDVIRLFPKLHLGQFTVIPAVADDAVFGWRLAGEIIRLRGAGDGGKCRRNLRECAALPEFCDARRVFADQRFGEADDVDDGKAIHDCSVRPVAEPGRATGSTLQLSLNRS